MTAQACATVRITGGREEYRGQAAGAELGTACGAYHDHRVRFLTLKRVQRDEICSFVGAKKKNVSLNKKLEEGWGDVWTRTAINADTKLCVSMAGRWP